MRSYLLLPLLLSGHVVRGFQHPRGIFHRNSLVKSTNERDDGKNEIQTTNNITITNFNGAYSGLSNAWGYSRSVVNERQRRRYERRRYRHRLKLEGTLGGKAPPSWAEALINSAVGDSNEGISAADAFVGNVKTRSGSEDSGNSQPSGATFDDNEMDEGKK